MVILRNCFSEITYLHFGNMLVSFSGKGTVPLEDIVSRTITGICMELYCNEETSRFLMDAELHECENCEIIIKKDMAVLYVGERILPNVHTSVQSLKRFKLMSSWTGRSFYVVALPEYTVLLKNLKHMLSNKRISIQKLKTVHGVRLIIKKVV